MRQARTPDCGRLIPVRGASGDPLDFSRLNTACPSDRWGLTVPGDRGSKAVPGRRSPRTGRPRKRASVTFNELFAEFLSFSAARGRSPTTLHGYETVVRGFWSPRIGDLALGALEPHTLDAIYAELLTRAVPVAPGTVRRYHAILSAALTQAVKWQWIASNPARLATLPVVHHLQPASPTPDQVRALISACTAHSEVMGMFVLLAAVTGCRRGELAALRWSDHCEGALWVRGSAYRLGGALGVKQTKTGRARRVTIDARLDETLNRWRERRLELAHGVGTTLDPGSLMLSSDPAGWIPVNINSLSSAFRRIADRLELPGVRLHSLRHFAATQLISSGIDVRTAATRLGHANPSMTLRVYAHTTTETEQQAAEVGSRFLRIFDTSSKQGHRKRSGDL